MDGTRQLTVKDQDSFRIIYIAELDNRIFILHAFKKKVEGADKQAMDTVTQRLARLNKDLKSGLT